MVDSYVDLLSDYKFDAEEDLTVASYEGFIMDIIATEGTKHLDFFTVGTNIEDRSFTSNALNTLVADKKLVRQGLMFMLPKNTKDMNGQD